MPTEIATNKAIVKITQPQIKQLQLKELARKRERKPRIVSRERTTSKSNER
jgi:hypothetical protein